MRLWDNATALKRLYHWLYLCIFLCLLGSAVVWAMHSPYFPVRQVKVVRPLWQVNGAEVQRISQKYLYGNIFVVDVNGAQQALSHLPWVASAQVKRVWPDTVQLDIRERVALARWPDGRLVDEDGHLFSATTNAALPQFTGTVKMTKDMVVQLLLFENMLQPIGLKVRELHLNDRLAWVVVLNNGILVRLGREHEQQRLSRFIEVWPQVLRNQADNIAYVDMRYPDGFALRYKNASGSQADNTAGMTAD